MAKAPKYSFEVPDYLNKPPAGRLELDLVPLVTMLACAPTLCLFYQKRRWFDFCAYGFGFIVAVVYHFLALYAHDGLAAVSFLGVHGAAWRTVDIMGANVLLARTMGHALNVDHPLIAVLPNFVLPVVLVALLLVYPTSMGVPLVTRVSGAVVGLTLVLQLGKGGYDMLRNWHAQYSHPRVVRAMTSMAVGIFCFTMPNRQPDNYWVWHSVWHVLMGAGYWDLYRHLLAVESPTPATKGAAVATSSAAEEWLTRQLSAEELKAAVQDARAAVGALVAGEALMGTGSGASSGEEEKVVRGRVGAARRSGAGGVGAARGTRSASRGADVRRVEAADDQEGSPAPPVGRARSAGKAKSPGKGSREAAGLGETIAAGPRLRPRRQVV